MVKVIPQINRERLHYVCYDNKQDKTFVTWNQQLETFVFLVLPTKMDKSVLGISRGGL